MTPERVEQIARICHTANHEYCKTIGDLSQAPWRVAPQWQRDSAIKGVEFHLGKLEAGETPSPFESHERWLKEKRLAGWKYGEVKDTDKKEHPCFVPYGGLPTEQRLKDFLFAAIVKAFFDAGAV